MTQFQGKTVLITGASSGIGAAAALAFGKAGASVIVHYRSGQAAALAVADSIIAAGGQAWIEQADVTDTQQTNEMIDRIAARCGRVDVLVNNAGGLVRRAPLVEADDAMIDEVFQLNARSVITVSRKIIPLMIANGGGVILNVTTQAARTGGGPGIALYAASKGFVSTLTRAMAKELAPHGIRVNAVAPGVIDTPFHDGNSSSGLLQAFAAAIPMGRLGTAQECAGAFLFLADANASAYVTGQIIEVNGGQVMP
ncbi:MAG: SDR family oxidoreductase [Pseudomonadota bacterium]